MAMCTSSPLEVCAYKDYHELSQMPSSAKASIRSSLWRYLQQVMESPGDEWDRDTGRRHRLVLENSTRSALLLLTKQGNAEWVRRVNSRLVAAIEGLFLEFVTTRAVPLIFAPWGSTHISGSLSLDLYHRYVRAYVSVAVADVIGCARTAAGLELRTACFVRYAGDFASHSQVMGILVAVASMRHRRVGAQSPGHCLDADCLWLVCGLLFGPGGVENAETLLPARSCTEEK